MPELVNKLSHGVRVKDENGNEHRLRAGQVKSVDGDAADRLLAVEGVESAGKDDKESWDAEYARMTGRVTDVPGVGDSLEATINSAREQVRLASVVLPLNTVIGDDDAPLEPRPERSRPSRPSPVSRSPTGWPTPTTSICPRTPKAASCPRSSRLRPRLAQRSRSSTTRSSTKPTRRALSPPRPARSPRPRRSGRQATPRPRARAVASAPRTRRSSRRPRLAPQGSCSPGPFTAGLTCLWDR